jgi:hypothetical protein
MQRGASAEIGRFSDRLAVWPVGSIELRRSCAAGPPGRPAAPVSTRQYHAVPVSTRQYPAVPVSTRQYHAVPVSTRQYPSAPVSILSAPGSTSRTSGGSDVYSVGCDTLHAADRQQAIRSVIGGSGSTHRYSVAKSLESGTGSHSAESAWATGRSGRGCTRAVSGRQRLQAHTKRDCNADSQCVCVCVCLRWIALAELMRLVVLSLGTQGVLGGAVP